ncbi:glycoside hydrolase family 3 N-terminal domain-containing protein [Acuticoccus sp. I52.16.1]|uniref:glycoside hydrolase family 3 N-terminal domain-containing protein n=1 Tax=Acuticoccus sp. I52.16.1 TaxID=2928472 RepID=UPI001FD15BD4|nr:glycoside hydrolase family 3 N-terminal domain-containing protein [Acuticoccus sp. I52.16.1]UOM35087.1 glycoside hydrolase family 3 protein [Acuticoccus sp. I52.16.1]
MYRRTLQACCAAIVMAAAVAAIAPTAAQKRAPADLGASETDPAGTSGADPARPGTSAAGRPITPGDAAPPMAQAAVQGAAAALAPQAGRPARFDDLAGPVDEDRDAVTPAPRAKPQGPARRRLAALLTHPEGAPLDVRIGQMLMVGFQGDDVDQPGPQRIARHIEAGRLGGVLIFRQNVKSEAALKRLTRLFRASAPPGLPVLIAVDQEGGQVQRLTDKVGFVATPSAKRVAAEGEPAARRIYRRLADGLADWGFNVNLAPVVDLGNRSDNPIISKLGRAFSGTPDEVAAYAAAFVAAHRRAGLLTSLKHFPGHGSSRGDTHEGFVDISRSWSEAELAPYATLLAEGMADMVMVAHVHLAQYCAEGVPASLSPQLIEGLLRQRLGFDGVVISDDMEMGAITRLGSPIRIARRAIEAGNDILVYAGGAAGSDDLVTRLHKRLAWAARDPALAARIDESFARVRGMKARLPDAARPFVRAPERTSHRPIEHVALPHP